MRTYSARCPNCDNENIITPTKLQHKGFWSMGLKRCDRCGSISRTIYQPTLDEFKVILIIKRDKK